MNLTSSGQSTEHCRGPDWTDGQTGDWQGQLVDTWRRRWYIWRRRMVCLEDAPGNIPLTSAGTASGSQGLAYGHVVFLDVLANYWVNFTTVFSHCISRKVLYDF